MPDLVLTCQQLKPSDWQTLSDTRLEALKDSPDAFAPAEDESSWTAQRWQEALATAVWVIARAGDDVVGLAMSVADSRHSRHRYLNSIWVKPRHRRQGVLKALIGDLIVRASEDGVEELLLWVLEDNEHAREVYRRLGFEPTGRRGPAPVPAGRRSQAGIRPDDPERTELEMRLRLAHAGPRPTGSDR